jgi:hypothetical protein
MNQSTAGKLAVAETMYSIVMYGEDIRLPLHKTPLTLSQNVILIYEPERTAVTPFSK